LNKFDCLGLQKAKKKKRKKKKIVQFEIIKFLEFINSFASETEAQVNSHLTFANCKRSSDFLKITLTIRRM
jgi:hypothetical protein